MRRIFLILLVLVATSAVADDSCAGRGTFAWLRATAPVKGKILFIHGLNAQPEKFLPLINVFRAAGYHTLMLTLSGHHAWEGPVLRAKACEWRNDAQKALNELNRRYPDLPGVALGYSLGGTLLADAAANAEAPLPPKMILLAPAIRLSFSSNLLRTLLPLSYFDVSVTSLAPEYYRLDPKMALKSYVALRDIVDAFAPVSHDQASKMNSINTLILMNEQDELVSYQGVATWLRQSKLRNWKLEPVVPDTKREETLAHILVDERSLGPNAWKKLQLRLLKFIN